MQENEVNKRIAEANKKGLDHSVISDRGNFTKLSASEAPGFIDP